MVEAKAYQVKEEHMAENGPTLSTPVKQTKICDNCKGNGYIRIDTVDGEPEWQVNYLQKDMENMCGEAKIDNIVNIAYEMNSEITNVEFFVRKYGDGARGKLRHHCDLSLVSMTILLNNFSDYEGGEFEYLNNREVKQSKVVNKGCGSFHNGLTIHGVEPVTRGNRWTLIAFFFDPENEYANEYNIIEWKK